MPCCRPTRAGRHSALVPDLLAYPAVDWLAREIRMAAVPRGPAPRPIFLHSLPASFPGCYCNYVISLVPNRASREC